MQYLMVAARLCARLHKKSVELCSLQSGENLRTFLQSLHERVSNQSGVVGQKVDKILTHQFWQVVDT